MHPNPTLPASPRPGIRTTAPDPDLVAAARLTPETSLEVFRGALDALARPGRPARLPVVRPDVIPAPLLPVLALADLEVAVHVLDGPADAHDDGVADHADRWLTAIAAATGARTASTLHDADLVLALRLPTAAEIAELRTGDARAPEQGARLVVAVDRIGTGSTTVTLIGPGAATGRTIDLDGPGTAFFEALDAANRGFPAGIDTWLAAPDGSVTAIPRSARISHVSVAGHDTGHDVGHDTGAH